MIMDEEVSEYTVCESIQNVSKETLISSRVSLLIYCCWCSGWVNMKMAYLGDPHLGWQYICADF